MAAEGVNLDRRAFARGAVAFSLVNVLGCQPLKDQSQMYGIIGKMLARDNARDELISILLEGTKDMPGCLSYVISKDLEDENALWITEVWESKESHQASLEIDSVKEAITKGRPLIAGFGERFETTPVGGHGLV